VVSIEPPWWRAAIPVCRRFEWTKQEQDMRPFWLVGLALAMPAAASASPAGDWLVADGTAVIRVAPCGQGAYCGKIAWAPKDGVDDHNPDASKRGRSIIGTTILVDMKPSGNNRWEGEIYNPEDGKTYSGSIAVVSPDMLRVEGCLLVFCGGENWTRTSTPPASTGRSGNAAPGMARSH
jgi:uncharacterized protein (DUF2147 family)